MQYVCVGYSAISKNGYSIVGSEVATISPDSCSPEKSLNDGVSYAGCPNLRTIIKFNINRVSLYRVNVPARPRSTATTGSILSAHESLNFSSRVTTKLHRVP